MTRWLRCTPTSKGYDLCLIDDAGTWGAGEGTASSARRQPKGMDNQADAAGAVQLPTGRLTPAQLDAMLNTIPLEITFIDDTDINRYWNDDGEKKLF